jgi:hypothetical protein
VNAIEQIVIRFSSSVAECTKTIPAKETNHSMEKNMYVSTISFTVTRHPSKRTSALGDLRNRSIVRNAKNAL